MSTIPMTSTRSRPAVDGAAAAARVLWKLRHDPAGIVLTLAAPVVLVLVFGYIFGSAIAVPGSGDYREFLVPGLFVTIAFNIIPSMITHGARQRARRRRPVPLDADLARSRCRSGRRRRPRSTGCCACC